MILHGQLRSVSCEHIPLWHFDPARVRLYQGGSVKQPMPLTTWVSIPAGLVPGPTAAQFSFLVATVTITSTYCNYPRRDGQAELTWVADYTRRWSTCSKAVAHLS